MKARSAYRPAPEHVAAACLVALVGLPGCLSWVMRAESIALQHTQHQAVFTPGAQNVAVSVQVNDKRDYLAPGISRKWGRAQVGYGRNSFGEHVAPDIIVVEPVETTVRKSIEEELAARGIRIAPTAPLQVVVDINVFFSDFKVGFMNPESSAVFAMDVKVLSSDGTTAYARHIAAQGRLPGTGTQFARVALDKALDDGIDTLFGDWKFASALLLGH